MRGLILAGGEGRRLADDGIATPKALVPIGGEPQLVRLAAQFLALGCSDVTCLLRARVPIPAVLRSRAGVHVIPCDTPGSLHTLALGIEAVGAGPVFCSMVDTVMARADWERVYGVADRAVTAGADVVLAITPSGTDESPLAVRFGKAGRVAALEDHADAGAWVTGGVYAFSPTIRAEAAVAVAAGATRMREFLRRLLSLGARVETVDVAQMVDLDRRRNLIVAEALVASEPRG